MEDNFIINERFDPHILDHPMKPFGMRYWEHYEFRMMNFQDDFLEFYSPQACSWLRDQEYLVDFKYYYDIENLGPFELGPSFLHIFPKIR